jgi:hypothetical protein
MIQRTIGFSIAALAIGFLTACAAPAPAPAPVVEAPVVARPAPVPAPAPQPECSAAGARFAVGQTLSPQLEAAARTRANATVSRVLRPGQAVTLEFNAARLNLEVDARSRVTSVRCG